YAVKVWDGGELRPEDQRRKRERWHQEETLAAEAASNWPIAVVHLSHLLEAHPRHPAFRVARAWANFQRGRREEANLDSLGVVAQGADVTDLDRQDFRAVWLRLELGDAEERRRLCTRLVERNAATTDPARAYLAARICGLWPDGLADPSRLVALARK